MFKPGDLPPNNSFLVQIKNDIATKKPIDLSSTSQMSQAKRFAVEYLLAIKFVNQQNYQQACQLFKSLSNQPNFKLNQVAFIKTLETCSLTDEELIQVWSNEATTIPNWLKENFYNTSLKIARQRKLNEYIALFLVKLSNFAKLREDKVKLMEEALTYSNLPEYKKKLYKVAPRKNHGVNSSNIYNIARDFERDRNFKMARKLYFKITQDKDKSLDDQVKAWKRIRLTFKKELNYTDYLNSWEKMLSTIDYPDEFDLFDQKILLARACWSKDQKDKGQAILESTLQEIIDNPDILARIYFVLGGISLEDNDFNKSLSYFQIAHAYDAKDQKLYEKIWWFVGWTQFLLKDYSAASETFGNLREFSKNYFLKLKVSYWEAKSLQLYGFDDDAKEIWERLSSIDSFGYYGILAHKELGIPFTHLSDLKNNYNHSSIVIPTFEWLVALDELSIGKNFIDEYTKKLKDHQLIEESLSLHSKVESFDTPIFNFYKIAAPKRNEILLKKAFVVFPTPHTKIIKAVAANFDIPPEYIYSIIRQESAFNHQIRSHADAFGLMQIIPERADQLAADHKITYNNTTDLYDIKTNVAMGTAHLQELNGLLQNKLILAIGSYNAGISRAKKWEEDRFDGDYIKFIEMVPYEETKSYIKLVIRNYIIYMRLMANKSFYFPTHIFNETPKV